MKDHTELSSNWQYIEGLKAENAKLRAALEQIDGRGRIPPYLTRDEMILTARTVLEREEGPG
jgi:hypothetical protein